MAASTDLDEIRLEKDLESWLDLVKAEFPDRYLTLQSQPNSIKRHVDAFLLYRDQLPPSGRVLDWGCRHAPDAALIRSQFGSAHTLLGIDAESQAIGRSLYEELDLDFAAFDHPSNLPYEDESIATVISSGVLEHVPHPNESLLEIYRVLEPGGLFVLTFLPNRWSWTEFVLRRAGSAKTHRRLYSRRRAERMLLDVGLVPERSGHHQFVPGQIGGRAAALLWPANKILERVWPFRLFTANVFVIARKQASV